MSTPTNRAAFLYFGFETIVVDADVLGHLFVQAGETFNGSPFAFWRDGLGGQPSAVLLLSGRQAAAVSRCHQPPSISTSGDCPFGLGLTRRFSVACAG